METQTENQNNVQSQIPQPSLNSSNKQNLSYPQIPLNSSKKLFFIFLLFVTIATIGIGGYFLSAKKTQLSQSPKPTAITTVVKPSPTPSVIPITFSFYIKILENTISQKAYISPKSSPPDLQPELFDPKLSKLEKIREEGPDDKYVYMVPNKPINVWIEQLSLSEPFQAVVYHFSGGGSSVNSSEVIEITHNNERDFLFTHVKGYAFSPDNKSLFLTNYVKNKNEWVVKKRIIEIETKKQIELPNVECTSAHRGAWDKEKLITHSDANIQGGCGPNGDLTKVCLWDRNGKLLKQLEANYWWYAGSECYLGSDFGLLPQDDNIFYSVVVRPQVGCYIAVQDLNNQQRNRTFKFVEEDLKASSPHCPALKDIDFTNFNFSSQKIKYRTGKEGEPPGPQSPWKEAIAEVQPTSQQPSKTYKNNTYGIEFQYDKDLVILYERKEGKTYIRGQLVGPQYKQNAINDQGPIVTLEDPTLTKKDGNFGIEIFPKDSDIGNCNNWTFNINSKKVFNNIEYQYAEFTGAYQTFSRHACVIHGDYTWLLAIDNQNKENLERSGKILNEILSTFKFIN